MGSRTQSSETSGIHSRQSQIQTPCDSLWWWAGTLPLFLLNTLIEPGFNSVWWRYALHLYLCQVSCWTRTWSLWIYNTNIHYVLMELTALWRCDVCWTKQELNSSGAKCSMKAALVWPAWPVLYVVSGSVRSLWSTHAALLYVRTRSTGCEHRAKLRSGPHRYTAWQKVNRAHAWSKWQIDW